MLFLPSIKILTRIEHSGEIPVLKKTEVRNCHFVNGFRFLQKCFQPFSLKIAYYCLKNGLNCILTKLS